MRHVRPILKPAARVAVALMTMALAAAAASPQSAQRPMLLVLNKAENTLAIVDPEAMKVLAKIPTGEGPHEVAVSADGRRAYVTNYGAQTPGSSISVIDLVDRKEVRRVDLGHLRRPHGIAEVDGKLYFTVETAAAVARYDPAADKVDWIMGTGQEATHMLALSPDRSHLYTANIMSGTVTAIRLAPQPGPGRIRHVSVGDGPEGIDVSPDGREVWASHVADGTVSVVDASTGAVKGSFKAGQTAIRVKFTPDGRLAVVSDPKGGDVVVYDAATRKELKRLAVGNVPIGVVVTPDSKRAFVALAQAGKVLAIDLERLEPGATVDTGAGPDGLAWAGR